MLKILYEDNHLIAVYKPAGVLSQGDKSRDVPIIDQVKEYIKNKYNKPGDVFLGLAHRLDRPVSGLILLARTSKALSRCNQLFKDRNIEKTYFAIVEEKPSNPKGSLVHYIKKDTVKNKARLFDKEKDGAKKALLEYTLISTSKSSHLIEVKPKTGRPHQIRAQLASMGCVIKNDVKYGAKSSNNPKQIYLHAKSLSFEHPVKRIPLFIECPLPNDLEWKKYSYV